MKNVSSWNRKPRDRKCAGWLTDPARLSRSSPGTSHALHPATDTISSCWGRALRGHSVATSIGDAVHPCLVAVRSPIPTMEWKPCPLFWWSQLGLATPGQGQWPWPCHRPAGFPQVSSLNHWEERLDYHDGLGLPGQGPRTTLLLWMVEIRKRHCKSAPTSAASPPSWPAAFERT